MLINELILSQVPVLKKGDNIDHALQAFDESRLNQLPVFDQEKLLGLIQVETVEEANPDQTIDTLLDALIPVFIYPEQHFAEGLKKTGMYGVELLPVMHQETKEYLGVILPEQFLQAAGNYINAAAPGAIIILEVAPFQYSFGELCRLIETNDAFITQLNTYMQPSTGMMTVCIKINKSEVSDIVSTLQRYEYQIKAYFGDEQYANELRENYEHLMNYLDI